MRLLSQFWWRTVKHEDIYLRGYETVPELYRGLIRYFHYYNQQRPHQGLGYQTPAEGYFAAQDCCPPGAGTQEPQPHRQQQDTAITS